MTIAVLPLCGWMLDLAVAFDAHHPGFAGGYLRASNERRQVVASYCAKIAPGDANLAAAATFLSGAGHKAILQAAFGGVPTGMRGALARSGAQPHDQRFYTTLHRLLASPRHPAIASTIRQMPQIDFDRLRILSILPSEVCAPNVVEVIGEVSTAKDVARLVELLVNNGVEREPLGAAIRSVGDAKQFSRLWDRWVAACPLPRSPLHAMPNCRAVATAGELMALAHRYRNCAARYVPEALEGTSAFGELHSIGGRPGMVVHLRPNRGQWSVEGLYLKQNGRPDPDYREIAYELLSSVGVERPGRSRDAEGQWSSLRRLTSRPFWDFAEG